MKHTTPRLELVAATFEHVQAELESPERLASMLGVQIGPGWPPGEYDRGAQEFFRDALEEGGADVVGWYHWYAIHKAGPDHNSVLVGVGGYLGLPNGNGEVEIGFSTMPDQQGLGYATEIANALIERAWADRRVCKVIAHTTPQNIVSCKVLTKAGFRTNGASEDDDVIRFEICR